MSGIDEAGKLDLEERARQLEQEAEQLRNAQTPLEEGSSSKREANDDFDRRLRGPLEQLRKIAGE